MEKNLNYGQALEAAKKGKLIARQGWNGKGMFVFMRPEGNLPINTLLSSNTIPNGVKDYYEVKNQPWSDSDKVEIKATAYLCMKAADDTLVNGWLASQTDMLSEDWCVLDKNDISEAAILTRQKDRA